MKKFKDRIKYWFTAFQYNWLFLGVLNSPFKRLKLHWYFGEIKIGNPYFLPTRLHTRRVDYQCVIFNGKLPEW